MVQQQPYVRDLMCYVMELTGFNCLSSFCPILLPSTLYITLCMKYYKQISECCLTPTNIAKEAVCEMCDINIHAMYIPTWGIKIFLRPSPGLAVDSILCNFSADGGPSRWCALSNGYFSRTANLTGKLRNILMERKYCTKATTITETGLSHDRLTSYSHSNPQQF